MDHSLCEFFSPVLLNYLLSDFQAEFEVTVS